MDKEMSGELVSRCFQARTDAHIAHLTTRSYAAHKALNEFYDEIIDLADAFAEAAQGRGGVLLVYPVCAPHGTHKDPSSAVLELREWIDDNRADCCDESELQNLIDEIVGLCDGTLYKLKFLA